MLNLICGTVKSGKTTYILDKINSLPNNKEVLLIVPEQSSFQTEKMLLNKFNNSYNKNINLFGFSNLCNEISRIYGGRNGRIIDNSTRFMIIQKVLNKLNGELLLFNRKTYSSSAVNNIATALTELKNCGASAKEINNIALEYSNLPIGLKMHDLALIMENYDAEIKDIFIDPLDDLQYALITAAENGYFKDKYIFFDGFTNFFGGQLALINQMFIDAEEITFAFCTDCVQNEFSIFANTNSTIKTVKSIAKKQNVAIGEEILLNSSYLSENMQQFENSYFNNSKFENNNCVSVISCANKYEEAEFAANTIHKLVRENNLRYRDFSIICRDIKNYNSVINTVFNKYGIPTNNDTAVMLSETPIASLILFALKASRNFSTKEIYKYLKSGISPLNNQEISILDEYVYLWGIDGIEWTSDFTKNPFGLNEKKQSVKDNKLALLNELRAKAINPIIKLSKYKKAPCTDLCKAVFNFLNENNIAKIYAEFANSADSSYIHISRYISSSWEAINNILDNIYLCFQNEEMSVTEFYEILQTNIFATELKGIPAGIDCVNVQSADRLITSGAEISFVFGNNYEEFPKKITDNTLITYKDRQILADNNIVIDDNELSLGIEEEYFVYKAYFSAKSKVYLLYKLSDYINGKAELSANLNTIINNSKIKTISAQSILNNSFETKNQLFADVCANYSLFKNNEVLEILSNFKEFFELLNSIDNNQNDYNISKNIIDKIYNNGLYLSATKIDKFYKCKYKYFLEFTLNFCKKEKIDLKGMQRGTIAHFVLENALKNDYNLLISGKITVIDCVKKYIEKYINTFVGGVGNLDSYEQFLFYRIEVALCDILPSIIDELKTSNFTPKYFELNFSLNNDENEQDSLKPIQFNVDGKNVNVIGTVDRVDCLEENGVNYIRIIDYKTGTKTFNISDILYGINLQLFVYMNFVNDNFNVKPVAALYQPVNPFDATGYFAVKNSKYIGITTNDINMLKNFGNEKYLPFTYNKDGTLNKKSDCINTEEFADIMTFTKNKIRTMVSTIFAGDVKNTPVCKNQSSSPCEYCEFSAICGKNEDNYVITDNVSLEDGMAKIKEDNSNV